MTAYYNENDAGAAAWLRELISAGQIAPGDVDERSIVEVQPSDLRGYRQCHFFGGVGGWSYALRLATISDDEPIWTGSCPCQPFSAAGQRKGYDDERDLWPAFFRLISECRPRVVFGEQVASSDVIGLAANSDMHEMWGGETILRISEWLKGSQISPLQGLHDDGSQGFPVDQTEASQGQQKMEAEESGLATDFGRSAACERKGAAAGDYVQGNPGASGSRCVRGNGYSVRFDDAAGLELPFIGPEGGGGRLYAREYARGDLRLQRDGECVGREAHSRNCGSPCRAGEKEIERLVGEISRAIEDEYRLEWITRIRIDLGRSGYAFGASILPACSIGAPHIRQRLYWLADANRSGKCGRFREEGRTARQSEVEVGQQDRKRLRSVPCGNGAVEWLADADGRIASDRDLQRSGQHGQQPQDGGAGGVGNTANNGQPRQQSARQWRSSSPHASSRINAEYVRCLDGKSRRVEPGIFPLVDRLPRGMVPSGDPGSPDYANATAEARMMRLRGYGNAIVPQVAAEFIRCAWEADPAALKHQRGRT